MFPGASLKKSLRVWGVSLNLAALAFASGPFDPASYAPEDVITRDFAVLGGGASGTYAAISLKDKGKSVVVIERRGRMGGHAGTYYDPATGTPISYGAHVYYNDSITRDFFERLNTPIGPAAFDLGAKPIYVDFANGLLTNYTIPPLGSDYVRELDKYPFISDGYHLPDPVPQDLLLTWPEYIDKFNLQDSAPATFNRPAVPGDLLKTLAIYVFTDVNHVMLAEQAGAAIFNANDDSSEIYRNALAELGSNVFLNSTVLQASRSTSKSRGVRLRVKTPTGTKLVIAKQLVLGIPAVPENLKPFCLDDRETGIISQISAGLYYTGVVKSTGLYDNYTYNNVGADTEYNVPTLPGVVMFTPTAVKGIFYYWYKSLKPMTREQVEKSARQTIKTLQKLTGGTTKAEPDFLDFSDHSPLHPYVSAQSISNGFYRDMYALQGYRNTWYVGALFVIGSSQLWNNTAAMLPEILAAAT